MEHSGRQPARREQSRAHVEAVALELFRERGVEAVTVEQICAAAGIGPATFYRYFGTKAGVLFAYRPVFLALIRETAAALPAGLSRGDQVRRVLEGFVEFLDQHAEDMSARDEIVARNPVLLPGTLLVQREWEAELAAALARARGVPASDPAAGLDASLGLLVVRTAFRRWRAGCAPSLTAALSGALAEVADAQEQLGRARPPTGAPVR